MNILRISKSEKWRKFKSNDPQTRLLGLIKKVLFLWFVNNK